MKYVYTYRSSDGERHTAEIEAESREAAFAWLRAEMGIKPIKVIAAGESHDCQVVQNKRHASVLSVLGVLGILAVLACGIWWWRRGGDSASYQVMTPQGPVTYTVAIPLPRQMIPGDRRRIEEAVAQEHDLPVFRLAAERWLARYAEPGRRSDGDNMSERPSAADFEAALSTPVRVASSDFTEVVDLKRIVVGIKKEMAAYLAGGGTVEQYLAELEKRQRLEISYRENAERRLGELLASTLDGDDKGTARTRSVEPDSLRDAYAYWLKANAHLQSMGIWPLPLPDALRVYQMNLDIDE